MLAEIPSKSKPESIAKVLSVRGVSVSDNNIKYVIAEKGETTASIARKNDLGHWQILKYNDLGKNESIMAGDIIYLQPKRNYAKQDYHTVESGETIRSISQRYGVKIKRLYKINGLADNYIPASGERIKLRQVSRIEETLTGHQ